ncbi:MAG: hypothetical protein ACKON9_28960, partial [Planctomycetaceae bacterium]
MKRASYQICLHVVLVVALVGLGCQSTGRSRVAATSPEAAVEAVDEDLTDGQVADIQTSLARTMEQR